MAIRHIERTARIDLTPLADRAADAKRIALRKRSESDGERVQISPQAERLRTQRAILQAAFGGVERVADSDLRDLFEAAGRGEYLDSIAQPTDVSPEATAKRILGGITGYIYGAFRLAHPDATVEDFDRFSADVLRGFERGLGEARSTIEGLSALTPELASGIDHTESLVREGLESFFAAERTHLAAGPDR